MSNATRGRAGGIVLRSVPRNAPIIVSEGTVTIGRCASCQGPIPRRPNQSDIAATCSPRCASQKFRRDNPEWSWPSAVDESVELGIRNKRKAGEPPGGR
jgi:hypothetical protein